MDLRTYWICVWAMLRSGEHWQAKRMHKTTLYTNQEIFRRAIEQFQHLPRGAVVQTMGVHCYMLAPSSRSQLSMFEDVVKKAWLTKSMDEINGVYGAPTIHLATTLGCKKVIKQKIPFRGTEVF